MRQRNWITTNYPVGSEIWVPHPRKDEWGTAIVVNHTLELMTDNCKGPTGIMVEYEDGTIIEIDHSYLNETGGGI